MARQLSGNTTILRKREIGLDSLHAQLAMPESVSGEPSRAYD